MAQRIRSFGGETRSRFVVTDGVDLAVTLQRIIWFDQDIDGRWLVWASSKDAVSGQAPATDAGAPGGIIVWDPTIAAFIELLGELIAHPERFLHEPVLGSPPEAQPT